jgi:hypothetical protein
MTTGNGRDPVAADEKRALDALRLAWGHAYHIGRDHGTWTAASKDAGHRTFTGDTPAALNAEIRTDPARQGTL